jgi:ABC-type sugar transport system substrate-binding protein
MVPDRQVLGHPGERHKSWLSELVPDDRAAGHLLAQSLIAAARRLHRGNGAVTLAGLGGTYTSSSLLRINGLRQAVTESADVTLFEVVPANWEIDRARRETARLLQLQPDLHVIWAASDLMALGAAEALQAAGKTPGVDVVVGGVDWAPFALEKVRSGTFAASVGGHFLDGAFALVLFHDHHRGLTLPTNVKSHLALATRENVERCERALARRAEVDFRRFSKAETPGLASYPFSVDAVL